MLLKILVLWIWWFKSDLEWNSEAHQLWQMKKRRFAATRWLQIRPKDHDWNIVGNVLLSSNSRYLFGSGAVQVSKQAIFMCFMTKCSCLSWTALFGVAVLVLGATLIIISVHHLTPSGHRVQIGAKIFLARYWDGLCLLPQQPGLQIKQSTINLWISSSFLRSVPDFMHCRHQGPPADLRSAALFREEGHVWDFISGWVFR